MQPIEINITTTLDNFNEADYLAINKDVADAIAAGTLRSGMEHFRKFGHSENRKQRNSEKIKDLREEKMRRIAPLIREDLQHRWEGGKVDFLTDELRAVSGIVDTQNISQNDYGVDVVDLIESCDSGFILDCGAGNRGEYYANVINMEIVDFPSTDILGVGEELPFKDESMDGVISVAVLEHVKDPFRCAKEIVRVLKPGGRLVCHVPFLAIFHGYPRHFFNMTYQGLRSLFEVGLEIDEQWVPRSAKPVWHLCSVVSSWAEGLTPETRDAFLEMPLRKFLAYPKPMLGEPFVEELSEEKNFELASGTALIARKPD